MWEMDLSPDSDVSVLRAMMGKTRQSPQARMEELQGMGESREVTDTA